MRPTFTAVAAFTLSALLLPGCALQNAPAGSGLEKAIAAPSRTPTFVARDGVRHPLEELTFFGVKPTMKVVDIWPYNGYWTEILAPYLHDRGTYYGVTSTRPSGENTAAGFQAKLDANKAKYDKVIVTQLGKDSLDIAPPNSVDMVLTFRNVHNWMAAGWADEAFAAFYKALKSGGILGVEEHRGSNDSPQDPSAKSGYVRQDYIIAMARKAGFVFVESSEINANPKDTKDYAKGVWTLPPTFAMRDEDRAKYAAIGEADSAVLKFRKP